MTNEELIKDYNDYIQGMIAAHEEWMISRYNPYPDPDYNEFATEPDGSAIIDA